MRSNHKIDSAQDAWALLTRAFPELFSGYDWYGHIPTGWFKLLIPLADRLNRELSDQEKHACMPVRHLTMEDGELLLEGKAACDKLSEIAQWVALLSKTTCQICGEEGALYSGSHNSAPLCLGHAAPFLLAERVSVALCLRGRLNRKRRMLVPLKRIPQPIRSALCRAEEMSGQERYVDMMVLHQFLAKVNRVLDKHATEL